MMHIWPSSAQSDRARTPTPTPTMASTKPMAIAVPGAGTRASTPGRHCDHAEADQKIEGQHAGRLPAEASQAFGFRRGQLAFGHQGLKVEGDFHDAIHFASCCATGRLSRRSR